MTRLSRPHIITTTAMVMGSNSADIKEIAEGLVARGGVHMLGLVRRLVEMLQSEGYPEAAARWDAIATIMSAIVSKGPEGEGPNCGNAGNAR